MRKLFGSSREEDSSGNAKAEEKSDKNKDENEDEDEDEEEDVNEDGVEDNGIIPFDQSGLQDYVIEWNDARLEKVVRKEIKKSEGDIMLSDVWELEFLGMSYEGNSQDEELLDISALKELRNLKSLVMSYSRIKDFAVLSELTNLNKLVLNYDAIEDLSVIPVIPSLEELKLMGNKISETGTVYL